MRDHDELLRRYLLGKLETEERSLLEERLIREEDLFEMAEAVDADLLDDYAHDRLAPEEREQVAQRLASSPRGRSRLALIRGLGTIADEEKNGRVLVFPSAFPSARRELTRFERAAAMAAMLAIAILGAWLAGQRLHPVQPPQVAGVPIPAPPAPTPVHRPLSPVVTPPPPPAEVIVTSTPPATPAPQRAAPWVIHLALNTFRGEAEIPVENVPPAEERVQLHLQLDQADKDFYVSFQAAVSRQGSEVFRADLKPNEIEDRWTLVVELDPKLPEGMYEVDVSGVTSSGSVEPIAHKELEIQRNASATAVTPD